jgi:hypothetical protein
MRGDCLRPYSALLSSNTAIKEGGSLSGWKSPLVLKARNAGGGCTTISSNIGRGSGSGDGNGVERS